MPMSVATGEVPCLVVDDEADDHAADDCADQEPTETGEVAPAQGVLGALIAHVPDPFAW